MKNFILFTTCLFFSILGYGQNSNCITIYNDAKDWKNKGDYDKALEKLQLLEQCDYKNVLAPERLELQKIIFNAIKKQKESAVVDRDKALSEKRKAKRAENVAIEARKIADTATKAALRERDNADTARQAALRETEKAVTAKKEAIEAKAKLGSLIINQHNKSEAYKKIQDDPTLAWNIATTTVPELKSMEEVIYTISNDDKNAFYKKTIRFDYHVKAIGWQQNQKGNNILLTATDDGVFRYWNTEGVVQDSFIFQTEEVRGVQISKTGRYLICGNVDSTFSIWNLENRQKRTIKHQGTNIQQIAFSNADTYWAICFNDHFEIYDNNGKLIDKKAINMPPNSIAISDAGIVVVGFDGQEAKFFEVKKGEKHFIKNPKLESFIITKACFATDTNVIFMGSNTLFNAQITNIKENTNQQMFGHSNSVSSVAISDYPRYLATGSKDKTIRLWQNNSDHYQEIAILKGHDETIEYLSFTQDAQLIASSTSNEVKIWMTNSKIMATSNVNQHSYFSISYLPNSKDSVLVGDAKGNIHLLNAKGILLKQWKHSDTTIKSIAVFNQYEKNTVSPEIKFITGSADGSVCVWNIKNNKEDTIILYNITKGKKVGVSSIVMHGRDGKFFTSYSDGSIVHRKVNGELINKFNDGTYSGISKTKIYNDTLVVAYVNGKIKLFNVQNYTVTKVLTFDYNYNVSNEIHALAVSQNGRFILASSEFNMKVWDWSNFKNEMDIKKAHSNRISDVHFSPDSKYFYSVGWDRTIYMWTIDGQKLYKVSNPVVGSMTCIDVSYDGSAFVTGSHVVNFWRTPQLLQAEAIEKTTDLQNFFLMPMAYYKKSNDFNLLRETAKKLAKKLELYEQADTLYKLASKALADNLKKENDSVRIEELNQTRREINIERCLILNQKYEAGNAFEKLINISQDTTDLEYYCQVFYERQMWQYLKKGCLRYEIIAKTSDFLIKSYLYIAQVELNEIEKEATLNYFKGLKDKETIQSFRTFFNNLATNTPERDIRQQVEYAKITYMLSQKLFYGKHDNQEEEDLNLDNLSSDNISLHWYLILKGDILEAKKTVEDGFKLLVGKGSLERYASSYKLMRMNFAHTLLFSGQILEAKKNIMDLADSTFVDNRFSTFRQAYLDDYALIEKYDSIFTKGKVIPHIYRQDYLKIKAALRNEPFEKFEIQPVFQPSNTSNTEGVIVLTKSPIKKYFLIVGSFKSQKDAELEISRLKKLGLLNLNIVQRESRFRIVALNTADEQETSDYKKILKNQYRIESWIFEQGN